MHFAGTAWRVGKSLSAAEVKKIFMKLKKKPQEGLL